MRSSASSSSGIDVAAVHLCAILPHAEFEALAGGTLYDQVDAGGPACSYVIDPGDGSAEAYFFNVYGPETAKPMMDYVRDYEEAEWLEGLGDSAYLQQDEAGDTYDLVVLVEGQFGLDMGGENPEVLQAAARVILQRLRP